MKTFHQLELQLWQALREAPVIPDADRAGKKWVGELWNVLECAMAGRELETQLEIGSQAYLEMAELVLKRANALMEEVVAKYSRDGPVMPANAFDRYVRQSTSVEFDRYVVPFARKEHEYPDSRESCSVAEEVTKEQALLLVGAELELEPDLAIAQLEYDEDIAAWANAIALWMQQRGCERVGFMELLDGVGFEVVKGWLAVLLDEGFEMDRLEDSDFYRSTGVFVALKQEEIAIAC